MNSTTLKEAKAILTENNEESIEELRQMKGYRKSIAFIKLWGHKKEYLTFDYSQDGLELIVNIRSCVTNSQKMI